MIDRSIAPPIHTVSALSLPPILVTHLSNGVPVYEIRSPGHEVVKIEVSFWAGRPYEVKPLAARTTSSLLKDGTTTQTSAEIAETIEYWGGVLSTPFSLDTAGLSLTCLRKHLNKLLPIFGQVVTDPAFSEQELSIFVQRHKQHLQVDLTKPDVVAYRHITEQLFGETHPYGYNSTAELFESIQRQDLITHYQRCFHAGNCAIFVSGKSDDEVLEGLEQFIAKSMNPKPSIDWERSFLLDSARIVPVPHNEKNRYIRHENTSQTAIRLGRDACTRYHPDHSGLFVLNTVFGGYFGSRLMNNIREEKGYTYNIYSSLDVMIHQGYLYIGTEVGNPLVQQTLDEIQKEMLRLQEEPLESDELEMVRNYLLGNFLTMVDGAFNSMEVLKTFVLEDLSTAVFSDLVKTTQSIEAEDIQALAKQYFSPQDWWQVIVGP